MSWEHQELICSHVMPDDFKPTQRESTFHNIKITCQETQ